MAEKKSFLIRHENEKYAGTGICCVTMPIQLELDASGKPAEVDVPAFPFPSLNIDGCDEPQIRYQYDPHGYFIRKQTYLSPKALVDIVMTLPEEMLADVSIFRNGSNQFLTYDKNSLSIAVYLAKGTNRILLRLASEHHRQIQIAADIYRTG